MTEFRLYCDFLDAKRKAAELDRISNELSKIGRDKIKNDLNSVNKNWNGSASDVFLSKGNKLTEDILSVAESLHNTADTIIRVAQRVYDSEMKALEIARKRTYQ